MNQFYLLVIIITIFGIVIFWSKSIEKKKGYYSRYKWTTDTGKAPTSMRSPFITSNAQYQIKKAYLSQKQVLDVFYTGKVRNNNVRVKQYNGYEVGIWCRREHDGHYLIGSCWKRKTY